MGDALSREPQTRPAPGSGGTVSFWLPRKNLLRLIHHDTTRNKHLYQNHFHLNVKFLKVRNYQCDFIRCKFKFILIKLKV